MRLEDYKKESLRKPRFREEYVKKDIKQKIAFMVRESRIKRGLTQKELAERMNTKQASISRVENEKSLPSLEFLEKMAQALDTQLDPPHFSFLERKSETNETEFWPPEIEIFSSAGNLKKQRI